MPTLSELLGLWHGDKETTGYAHPRIAYEVCRIRRPPSQLAARHIFYTAGQLPEVDVELLRMIDRGYELWKEAGSP